MTADTARAVEWYTRAAESGDRAAQCNLGYCLLNGIGTARNPAGAVEWFKRAAEQGSVRAMNLLADCCRDGVGTEPDRARAEQLYQEAARQGSREAEESLKKLYAVKPEHHQAKKSIFKRLFGG